MSVNATKAIPTAAGISVLKSSNDTSGTPERRQAGGDGADHGTSSARPSAATAAVAPTTARNTPGTFGATRRRPRISASDRDADGERGRVGLVESRDEVAHSAQEVLRVDREPEQLGQLRDDDGHGDAHQVAEPHGHRQQFGHEAEPRQPAGEHDRPDEDGEHPGERDPRRRVAGRRQRDDRRGDERRDRRVGSQDEDPRRAQQEVHDERHERRVEPGDRRHARELGVRHALRDEQRGEDDARDDVAAQVGAAVASQQREPRHPTTETSRAFHERTLTAATGAATSAVAGRAMLPARRRRG